MVGIVVVCHSHKLANGLVELVRQIAAEEIPIAVAAGVGEQHQELGTDATQIVDAITSVYSEKGVLVIMDLGSAILSAEMALELLPENLRQNVVLCAAPLVEGTIAASVQAGLGSDLHTICHEACRSLEAKTDHLEGEQKVETVGGDTAGDNVEVQSIIVTLTNPHGLHVRPAAQFVQLANAFDASVFVTNLTNGKGPVSAKSLNSLATLGAIRSHQIKISASGEQATVALTNLGELVREGFGEIEEKPAISRKQPPDAKQVGEITGGMIQAIPLAEGIAIAPLFIQQIEMPEIPHYQPADLIEEWNQIEQAINQVVVEIKKRRNKIATQGGDFQASILDAHLLILQDPQLLDDVRTKIFEERSNAAEAWISSINMIIANYQALDDPYQRARCVDVKDVGDQVLVSLLGTKQTSTSTLDEPQIVYAAELTPNQIASFDSKYVLGLIMAQGSPTSHAAILARSLGLPAVCGVDIPSLGAEQGTQVALDGNSGSVWINPQEQVKVNLDKKRQSWQEQRQEYLKISQEPAMTRDGKRVEVAANVGNPWEAKVAKANGAEGIGVLRTEFLYLKRNSPPSEDEQLATLQQIGEQMGGLPTIVRTLDVGGDKELAYIKLPKEANPFLGMRAIRLSLQQPQLIFPQLRAILRAGADHPMQVMFPMIATLEELMQAKDLLEQAHHQLSDEKTPHRWPIATGIMVEIPAAALLSEKLAPHTDFFSIGTNDLTQYTLAAERGNPQLDNYQDALHPAILLQVKLVVESAHKYGKWVGVCGEIASDRLATPVLVGLGVDELSMNSASIPQIKANLRYFDSGQAGELAQATLTCENAQQVRILADDFFIKLGF